MFCVARISYVGLISTVSKPCRMYRVRKIDILQAQAFSHISVTSQLLKICTLNLTVFLHLQENTPIIPNGCLGKLLLALHATCLPCFQAAPALSRLSSATCCRTAHIYTSRDLSLRSHATNRTSSPAHRLLYTS
jgi:hypothetical protein